MKKFVFIIGLAVGIWALIHFLNPRLQESIPPPACDIFQIAKGSIELAVKGRGRVGCRIEEVHSQERGRIIQVFVKEGDRVNKNQPLVQIQPAPFFLFEIKRASLKLQQARLAKKRVQKELKRERNLYQAGLTTEHSVEMAEKVVSDTENEIKIQMQLLKNYETKTGRKIIDSWDWEDVEPLRINILAPFRGTVLAIKKLVGDPVFPSEHEEETVLTIGDLDEYFVRYYISEMDINKIRVNQAAEVIFDTYPEKVFAASVDKVSNIAARPGEYDFGGRTNTSFFAVKLLLDKVNFPLRIGLSCRVKIITQNKEDILVAPIDAVLKEEARSYILMPENNELKKKFIKTGIHNEHFIEIAGGAQIGDEICKRPLLILEQWKNLEMEKNRTWIEKLIR